ncbi:MAG: GIY-YIG nuclease family protein [bacterium]|nr:GIY-YIG nuclease family protein [bacterium]
MKRAAPNPHVVYILECADKTLYVGCTNNLEKRLHQHNNLKSGAHYTKIRRPVVLVYSENFKTLGKARHREAEIKGLQRKDKITLIKTFVKNVLLF